MTSSSAQHQPQHQTKFRWTENLTCRFIQLRKEHGKMFTGRKYSAQAGWEYILQQMREEFPNVMTTDVHYRVLKKKWSNLLQQYKELKNPVHGDKNRPDEISWPFYNAIDEVLSSLGLPRGRRRNSCYDEEPEDEEHSDRDLDPQEFLCVSVAQDSDDELNYDPLGDAKPPLEDEPRAPMGRAAAGLQPLLFDVDRLSRATRNSGSGSSRKRSLHGSRGSSSEELLSRLPRATELTIRPIRAGGSGSDHHQAAALEPICNNGREELEIFQDAKRKKREEESSGQPGRSSGTGEQRSGLERRVDEFLEYARRRDEENRAILVKMLEAIEDIRDAVRR
ncbi:uncharacterized protein LOC106644539 isoform X2 [Copidosoma floridanum]|uniref:uncharacterized protein LOC106644539 isoform X2 n=1 Tax=Copidosoma floridanum TaxID=29053 RepID=UPI000C6F72EE|nr:uncharacterized protein LOC106644539 isoform X2 [Copidosoma floridanum]